jgi:hypothetical protein
MGERGGEGGGGAGGSTHTCAVPWQESNIDGKGNVPPAVWRANKLASANELCSSRPQRLALVKPKRFCPVNIKTRTRECACGGERDHESVGQVDENE